MAAPAPPYQTCEKEVYYDQAHNAPIVFEPSGDQAPEVVHRPMRYGQLNYDPNRRVCGCRSTIFWSLCTLVTVIVLGIAIGVPVGIFSSEWNSGDGPAITTTKSSSASSFGYGGDGTSLMSTTSTPSISSTTSSAPSATSTVADLGSYTCPQSNNTDYETTSGSRQQTFRQLCGIDWPQGVNAAAGSATTTVIDVEEVVVYSLKACIEECASWSAKNGQQCVAVTYGANISLALSRSYGNCYLKTAVGANPLIDRSGQEQAAYLVTGS